MHNKSFKTNLSKPHSTVLTLFLNLLPLVALRAYKLCNRLPVEVMLFILIMAIPADVNFVAAWCLKSKIPISLKVIWTIIFQLNKHILHCSLTVY